MRGPGSTWSSSRPPRAPHALQAKPSLLEHGHAPGLPPWPRVTVLRKPCAAARPFSAPFPAAARQSARPRPSASTRPAAASPTGPCVRALASLEVVRRVGASTHRRRRRPERRRSDGSARKKFFPVEGRATESLAVLAAVTEALPAPDDPARGCPPGPSPRPSSPACSDPRQGRAPWSRRPGP